MPFRSKFTEVGDLGVYELPVDSTKHCDTEIREVSSPLGSVIYSSDFVSPSRPPTSHSEISSTGRNLNTSRNFVNPSTTLRQISTDPPQRNLMQPIYCNPQVVYQPSVPMPIQGSCCNGQVAVNAPISHSVFPGYQNVQHANNYMPLQTDIMQMPVYYTNQNNSNFSSPYQWSYHYNQPPVRQYQQHTKPPTANGFGQNMTINTTSSKMEMHQNAFGQSMNITYY